jgi:hypothetical protein
VGESIGPVTVGAGREAMVRDEKSEFTGDGSVAGGCRELEAIGTSGNMIEGAGLGEGMFRNDSLDDRRRAGTEGTEGMGGTADMIICFARRERS